MFGFPIDNTIGGTSQPNGWMDNWVDFYRERRLNHQLKLTKDPSLQKLGKKLCDNLEHFFEGLEVRPMPAAMIISWLTLLVNYLHICLSELASQIRTNQKHNKNTRHCSSFAYNTVNVL